MPRKGEMLPKTKLIVVSYVQAKMSLDECASMYGISYERVRQIIKRWAPRSLRPGGKYRRKRVNGTTKRRAQR